MAVAPFQVLLRDLGGRSAQRSVAMRRTAAAASATGGAGEPGPDGTVLLWEGTQFSTPHARAFQDRQYYRIFDAYGCLGLLPVRKDVFAVFVTNVEPVGSLEGETVFCISGVRFVSLTTNMYDNAPAADRGEYVDPATQATSTHPCADAQKFFVAGMFFFAPFIDMTSNAQRRALVAAADAEGRPDVPHSPWATVDMRFLWNRYLLKDLLRVLPRSASGTHGWPPLVLAIQGYFRSEVYKFGHKAFNVALVSRVSPARTGTRFNVRGVDDDGHCANFVETEQLVYHPDGSCLSFVQVRGSVPLFWEQDGVQIGGHRVTFSRHPAASAVALRRHFDDLVLRYGGTTVVSLLAHRGGELPLADAYRRAVAELAHPLVHFTAFDFHYETRDGFEAVSTLIGSVAKDLRAFGCFVRDGAGHVVARQEGIFRTNCLDCLDRYARRVTGWRTRRTGVPDV